MKKSAPAQAIYLISRGKPLVDKDLQVSIAGTSDYWNPPKADCARFCTVEKKRQSRDIVGFTSCSCAGVKRRRLDHKG